MPVQQVVDLPWPRTPGRHADPQVRAVEARDEDLRPAAEQPLHDVLARNRVRGRREGADPGVGEVFRQFGEAAVVRPEVVSPLGDAVRLVDGEPRRTVPGEAFQDFRPHEPLRRNVEQAQSTVAQLAVRLDGVSPRRRRIERAGRHAVEAQRGHLIAHQRDERRHHHGQALGRQGWKLVAHRLARTGRHHRQNVVACQQSRDDLRLSRPEPVMTEDALQERKGNVGGWQRCRSNWLRLK